jgi:glycosyltransferase involved in cell wall biosynthesis
MNNNPLVSIIIRTKDRPVLLKMAIASIAGQTYRPIEVVLVNDGGCDLDIDELKGILGDITPNYIRLEKNSGRAHAGNVGIEYARGDYIGFLDDDDELYPDHIETLLSFMKESKYEIVYSAVDFIEKKYDANQIHFINKKKGSFAQDFSYNNLLIGNYIPLIALLFESDLLKKLMFDESFELYEDWDMLIRAGESARLHFINKTTAAYNQWCDSQIAFKSSPEKIREATLKLYEKHRVKIPVEVIFGLREESSRKDNLIAEKDNLIAEKDNLIAEKDNLIAEKDDYISALETRMDNLEKDLKEKNAYIHNIHSGRGWRLLTKYFKIRDRFLRMIH